jgi:integrase
MTYDEQNSTALDRFRTVDPPKSVSKNVPTPSAERSNGSPLARKIKTSLAYWEKRIFQRRAGGNWWMLVQHGGRRTKLSLDTPIKAAAAAKARDVYLSILANGWDETLRAYRPERANKSDVTLGEFLDELAAKADLKAKTREGYAVALRKIVADSFGIDGGKAKYDAHGGGRVAWLERVHAIKLRDLTPAVVQKWKRDFLGRAGKGDPLAERTAKISVNSIIRRAKSLFAPDALQHLECTLPKPLPFEGIKFEPRQSMRYRSTIDPEVLTKKARAELAEEDPDAFLAFLLALGVGLRRIEIDRLEWDAFRWNENVVRIEPTEHFDVKTEHSIGDVPIDRELMAIFKGYHAQSASNFVLETDNLPRPNATFENYRAQAVFERLAAWLRENGVSARKPIHELRKEFGSMVNRKHGLSAAKDLLRHADIAITASHYIDSPRKATSGLGALLTTKRGAKKIIDFTAAEKVATGSRRASRVKNSVTSWATIASIETPRRLASVQRAEGGS